MESFWSALALVFVAELGDKTQLVALGFGARYRLAPVMFGVVLGYAASTLLSVVVGGLLGAALPTRWIGIGGGLLFLGFAAWTVLGPADHDHDEAPTPLVSKRVVMTVATAMFVAELGDKTMIATATLAAQGDPALVWVGATVGIILSGAIAVLVGRFAGARIPERAVRIGSAVLFALFGVVLLVTSI